MKNPYEVYQNRLIYVFSIPYKTHEGLLKIGETTLTTATKDLPPNCNELNQAARKRIKQYTNTANIPYKLLHTELAVTDKNISFRDTDVHDLLERYREMLEGSTGREWFRIDLDTARQAIKDVKSGKKFLTGTKSKPARVEIDFRPEQEIAISRTVKYFETDNKFLWNAKMRFGKTLCALEVVSHMNLKKTIIVTHRPVVNAGWFDDFNKIFHDANFIYGSYKDTSYSLEDLLKDGRNFVYFISVQDLRGSQTVGGKFDKNNAAFKTKWDLVIVDEAHEGIKTQLGDAVIKNLVKTKTKFLALSGTPFNLIGDFSDDNIYTWDYVMEQQAKVKWDAENFGDTNPYDELPRMNIFTYNLGKLFNYVDAEEYSFSFREFFKTDNGKFTHAADIQSFLNLLVKPDDNNYPYSTKDFRNIFRHTF